MSSATRLAIHPLRHPEGSKVNFGALVTGIDIEKLTGKFTMSWP